VSDLEPFDRATLERGTPVYVHRCPARFQDIDAAGFLFFARVFDYFHDAWLAYMEARGAAHSAVIAARDWGAPIRRSGAEYLAPVRFGDNLEVGLVKGAWSGSLLTIGYRVAIVGGRVAAVGSIQHVIVSMQTMKRIAPSERVVELFRPLCG
jgi:acyl-CoA thioesterase FadM